MPSNAHIELSPAIQEQAARIRTQFSTFQDFCNRFTPTKLKDATMHPTQCVTCSAPTLTYLDITYGEGSAVAWLVIQLTYMQLNINVPRKMTELELETCAQTIFENYYHIKTTEIMLFLARLMGGSYPVNWNGYVRPSVIHQALHDCFIPWRRDLINKLEKLKEERKRKTVLNNPDNMTYDEWQEIKMLTRMYEMQIPQRHAEKCEGKRTAQ